MLSKPQLYPHEAAKVTSSHFRGQLTAGSKAGGGGVRWATPFEKCLRGWPDCFMSEQALPADSATPWPAIPPCCTPHCLCPHTPPLPCTPLLLLSPGPPGSLPRLLKPGVNAFALRPTRPVIPVSFCPHLLIVHLSPLTFLLGCLRVGPRPGSPPSA